MKTQLQLQNLYSIRTKFDNYGKPFKVVTINAGLKQETDEFDVAIFKPVFVSFTINHSQGNKQDLETLFTKHRQAIIDVEPKDLIKREWLNQNNEVKVGYTLKRPISYFKQVDAGLFLTRTQRVMKEWDN